jgi:hypothetical protein
MKKATLILAMFTLALTSCKKEQVTVNDVYINSNPDRIFWESNPYYLKKDSSVLWKTYRVHVKGQIVQLQSMYYFRDTIQHDYYSRYVKQDSQHITMKLMNYTDGIVVNKTFSLAPSNYTNYPWKHTVLITYRNCYTENDTTYSYFDYYYTQTVPTDRWFGYKIGDTIRKTLIKDIW